MDELRLKVEGMHCRSCVELIREELEDLGSKDLHVELDQRSKSGSVSLRTEKPKERIKAAIESLGEYKVRG